MTERCAACGAEVGDDAARCSDCGLALGRDPEDAPPLELGTPDQVGALLGFAPNVVATPRTDDSSVEIQALSAPPQAALEPRIRRRRLIVAGLVALGVIAAVVAVIRARRPDDYRTREELAFERFRNSDRLARVDIPDSFDPDAIVADLARGRSGALQAATAAHRPLPPAGESSLHDFFDAFLDRFLEIAPDWAFALGVHPHPSRVSAVDDTARIRGMMLMRDAWRTLRAWPRADALSAHDRADLAALLGWVESTLRWTAPFDRDLLALSQTSIDPLIHLAEIACCPAEDRVAAAAARLNAMPDRLRIVVDLLKAPPWPLVLAAARQAESADAYLAAYPGRFRAASQASVERLRAALGPARAAFAEFARRLRSEVVSRAKGEAGIGPWNVAVLLRLSHGLPLQARDVYEHALETLRRAHDELRRLEDAAARSSERNPDQSPEVQVRALRDGVTAWVSTMPPEGGLVISEMPKIYADVAAAVYRDAGTLSSADAGVVHVAAARAGGDDLERRCESISLRHVFAHETYPGHRMEAVFRRNACALRRFVDDRVFVEGWAVYAEDLLHDVGGCTNGPTDDWVRASERASRCIGVLLDLLVETGAASPAELVGLLEVCGWPNPTVEDLGARQMWPLSNLGYLLGRDEILRLRRGEEERLGDAFDLRAFHVKLLSSGPIPPRLIAEEWGDAPR